MSKLQQCAGFSIAFLALAGALAFAAPEPPAKSPPEPLAVNIPLAQEQLKLIDQIVADLDRLWRGGELSLVRAGFDVWAQRRVEALRASGARKAEVVQACEEYVNQMKRVERAQENLFK